MNEATPTPTPEPTQAAQCCLVREPTEAELAQLEVARLRAVNASLANENVSLCIYLAGTIGVLFGFIYARYL